MKKNLCLIIVVFSIFSFIPAEGQFLNKLQRQIQRKSEEHALKEADKAADKGLDKAAEAIWKSIEEKENSGDTTSSGSGDAGHDVNFSLNINSGAPVPVEDHYAFDTRVAYQFSAENPDNREEEPIMDLISWYKEGKQYSATRIKASENGQPLNVLLEGDDLERRPDRGDLGQVGVQQLPRPLLLLEGDPEAVDIDIRSEAVRGIRQLARRHGICIRSNGLMSVALAGIAGLLGALLAFGT